MRGSLQKMKLTFKVSCGASPWRIFEALRECQKSSYTETIRRKPLAKGEPILALADAG